MVHSKRFTGLYLLQLIVAQGLVYRSHVFNDLEATAARAAGETRMQLSMSILPELSVTGRKK
jgi:hypothetical protein